MSTYKTERILESEYLNRNAYKTELMNDYSIRMSAYKTEKILESEYLNRNLYNRTYEWLPIRMSAYKTEKILESEYLIIREIIITKH